MTECVSVRALEKQGYGTKNVRVGRYIRAGHQTTEARTVLGRIYIFPPIMASNDEDTGGV
jgi:hypothetical protein